MEFDPLKATLKSAAESAAEISLLHPRAAAVSHKHPKFPTWYSATLPVQSMAAMQNRKRAKPEVPVNFNQGFEIRLRQNGVDLNLYSTWSFPNETSHSSGR
jgi:hypothetical protein